MTHGSMHMALAYGCMLAGDDRKIHENSAVRKFKSLESAGAAGSRSD
jgi:hypothetical protein